MSVFVIAEPGGTAEGDLSTMHRLIEAAADAGCDAIKPQWTSSPERMVARRQVPADYLRFYGWLAYPLAWHHELAAHAHERGLAYGVSTYLPEDVKAVHPYVDFHKLSSFEALDRAMLDAHEDAGGHLIISTGMLSQSDCEWLDAWRTRGNNVRRTVELLHCTSAYPAPLESLNLNVLTQSWCDGLSDHSRHIAAGAMARQLGARVIEAHLRLDDCAPDNPDYAVALAPDDFRDYVYMVHGSPGLDDVPECEAMLGDGVKRPHESEAAMARYRVTT